MQHFNETQVDVVSDDEYILLAVISAVVFCTFFGILVFAAYNTYHYLVKQEKY